jgi:hypothetical protein
LGNQAKRWWGRGLVMANAFLKEVTRRHFDITGIYRQVQFAALTPALSGQSTIVSAIGGFRIHVLSAFVLAAAPVTFKFQSANNDIFPTVSLVGNGGFVLPENIHGWFITNVNEALNVNLGAAVSVGVQISYIQSL